MKDIGKFIVIYGPNNIGKSTQVKLLADSLKKQGKKVKVIKYPIYDLEPTGPLANKILRQNYKLPELDAQRIFAQNRRDYEPILTKTLQEGTWVIAEDYKGTGIAWGMVRGVPIEDLEKINSGLLNEDIAISLDGERFLEAVEKNHINEDSDLWSVGRKVHLQLAKRYAWTIVNANQSIELVNRSILEAVKSALL